MRIWLHHSVKSPARTGSAVVSLVTHALLIGGAVAGTERAADALRQRIAERVVYLPPPDRTPSQAAVTEQLRYVALGAGPHPRADARAGDERAMAPPAALKEGAAASGHDDVTQAAQPASAASTDSVYSVLDVDVSAARMESSAAPLYPPALRERMLEGSVIARYVVDSTGHADPSSLVVLAATDPAFAQSVREALPGMRFRPGLIDGQPVRQLVEQRFAFRLTVAPPAAGEPGRVVPSP